MVCKGEIHLSHLTNMLMIMIFQILKENHKFVVLDRPIFIKIGHKN